VMFHLCLPIMNRYMYAQMHIFINTYLVCMCTFLRHLPLAMYMFYMFR
jgi:hypothetical protein